MILKRVARFEDGLFGEVRSLGEGVYEAKFRDGPAYRVYFAQTSTHIYLLGGGEKTGQQRDIDAAKEFWRQYAKTRKII